MRIDRIQVRGFGRLSDFDTGPDPLASLVTVLGPNEAGKSTLFAFLTTALYGFQPATRERNPRVPWGADEAAGLVHVRLDAGGCAEVERTLRSQPSGRVTVDGRTSDLRNHPVPWVGHVPRTVFRQVFAITLSELAGLDAETWARIQDKVIGSMGAADLLSARAVADALEREAGEIWRPNRRGNQALRDLQASLRELRGRRAAARERDAEIRRLVEEREHVRTELQDVRERRQLDRAEVDRAGSLLPIKRQLDRIAALRAQAGPPHELEGLPPDPLARHAELVDELARHRHAHDAAADAVAEREATLAQAAAFAPLLEHREDVVSLVAQVAGSAPDRLGVVELAAEVDDVEARLDAAASPILATSWRDVPAEALASVPVDVLRDRLVHARRADPPTRRTEPVHPLAPLGLVAAGVGLLAWGLTTAGSFVAALGAAGLAAGAAWWAVGARERSVDPSAAGGSDGRGRTRPADDIRRLLRGLPIRPERLARPDESLAAGLERLRELARSHAELVRALGAARARVAAVDEAAAGLAHALERPGPGSTEVFARDVDRELREAEALKLAAASAERELGRLRSGREESARSLQVVEADIARLTERAQSSSPGEPGQALERAGARLAALHRADQLEDELVAAHPDLDDLRAQIAGLERGGRSWSVDEGALARARARVEAHEERIEELLRRGESLEGDMARLRELDTVDAVDSESTSLRDEEARLMRARDRKWVLARLLREADRRFRDEHQPDLLRRASSYLHHLTGGRYERLVIDETETDRPFQLVGPGLPAPVPLAPPVSTGTLEQAYLSLRLAIVDHLDQGGERLPLFVDEVFVNWDGERRARGLEVLAGIAGSRQVFVFTCHPAVARELEGRGGRILELDGR